MRGRVRGKGYPPPHRNVNIVAARKLSLSAGAFQNEALPGIEYPKMQLLTVAEILDGKRFKTPTVQGRHELEPRLPGIRAIGV